MADHDKEQPRLSHSPVERPIDGHPTDELADRRAEGRRRARVMNSVRDFMKGKRKRHGR